MPTSGLSAPPEPGDTGAAHMHISSRSRSNLLLQLYLDQQEHLNVAVYFIQYVILLFILLYILSPTLMRSSEKRTVRVLDVNVIYLFMNAAGTAKCCSLLLSSLYPHFLHDGHLSHQAGDFPIPLLLSSVINGCFHHDLRGALHHSQSCSGRGEEDF